MRASCGRHPLFDFRPQWLHMHRLSDTTFLEDRSPLFEHLWNDKNGTDFARTLLLYFGSFKIGAICVTFYVKNLCIQKLWIGEFAAEVGASPDLSFRCGVRRITAFLLETSDILALALLDRSPEHTSLASAVSAVTNVVCSVIKGDVTYYSVHPISLASSF